MSFFVFVSDRTKLVMAAGDFFTVLKKYTQHYGWILGCLFLTLEKNQHKLMVFCCFAR